MKRRTGERSKKVRRKEEEWRNIGSAKFGRRVTKQTRRKRLHRHSACALSAPSVGKASTEFEPSFVCVCVCVCVCERASEEE